MGSYGCVPHEGIWCDGGKCVCVLRASGVMGEAMVVCLMRASGVMGEATCTCTCTCMVVCLMRASGVMGEVCLCAEGIWCEGGSCGYVSHEGIWCDGGRCVCVLRASGVRG